ncbi:hypothetical protein H696_04209 [Fonticula alba]|uniref:tRNA/rRNA methyltransferase SpoU type domain-containing protein n=1 Tax=Fonticula alba TaxID=691883 RepID=A0A058Z3E7_FONAL|nr:hypothetical protein H696_04209 [Fonticula alba]KCV68790.1 hypothetical protein H696_04209 [Fonticula alba]|eukprot:XP_009496361.1 hypothetical protein H696_04209 [Fonticula alba]
MLMIPTATGPWLGARAPAGALLAHRLLSSSAGPAPGKRAARRPGPQSHGGNSRPPAAPAVPAYRRSPMADLPHVRPASRELVRHYAGLRTPGKREAAARARPPGPSDDFHRWGHLAFAAAEEPCVIIGARAIGDLLGLPLHEWQAANEQARSDGRAEGGKYGGQRRGPWLAAGRPPPAWPRPLTLLSSVEMAPFASALVDLYVPTEARQARLSRRPPGVYLLETESYLTSAAHSLLHAGATAASARDLLAVELPSPWVYAAEAGPAGRLPPVCHLWSEHLCADCAAAAGAAAGPGADAAGSVPADAPASGQVPSDAARPPACPGSCSAIRPPGDRRLLVLDGVADPGNLGTLIRLADSIRHRSGADRLAWPVIFLLEPTPLAGFAPEAVLASLPAEAPAPAPAPAPVSRSGPVSRRLDPAMAGVLASLRGLHEPSPDSAIGSGPEAQLRSRGVDLSEVVGRRCADLAGDKVLRSAAGASHRFHPALMPAGGDAPSGAPAPGVRFIRGDWPGLVALLQRDGLRLVAGDCPGPGVVELDMVAASEGSRSAGPAPGVALLLGSEGPGVGRLVRASIEQSQLPGPQHPGRLHTPGQRIAIPLVDGRDSLNVATAGSILMWALR